ncbi:MAG: SH3 domain-containing protein [Saprospiraceae bacterium]
MLKISQREVYLCRQTTVMQTFIRIAIGFAAVFQASWVTAQMTFFPEDIVVTASVLNLRDKPDKSGKVLEKLSKGSSLTLVEVGNGGQYVEVDSVSGLWLKVKSPSKTGYVFSPYVSGTYYLCADREIVHDPLPPLNWYGIYVRDSFADELRKIEIHRVQEYNEAFMENVDVLYTNQRDTAKFIIGSAKPLKAGFVSSLGLFDPNLTYYSSLLSPGAMMPIHPGTDGQDAQEKSTYYLAATGCAQFGDSDFVQVTNFRLHALNMVPDQPTHRQDLTGWVQPGEGLNPNIGLIWYGDLDGDNKPDAILEDAPYEVGSRISLYLTSAARPGMLLHKVCEHFFVID